MWYDDVVWTAPSAPQNVASEAYSPNAVRVTWQSPAEPQGPLTDVVYVVEWHSFNADGSRAEGRVETGSTPHKVTSRSLQRHSDDRQHIFLSNLQPSRTYNIRVCIWAQQRMLCIVFDFFESWLNLHCYANLYVVNSACEVIFLSFRFFLEDVLAKK